VSTTFQPQTTEPATSRGRASLASRLPFRPHVILAIFRRDLGRFFSNVAGYVYIVLFLVSASVAAFWPDEFFANNLATLDQLNKLMPYLLLLFVPAITMNVWAEERRHGTEELLLTLPARDIEVVLGKYFAALGIFFASLAFLAVGLTAVLEKLGSPDYGILFSTFIGYALTGAALIAVGMVASAISSNVTVAFILGALFCSFPIFTELLGGLNSSEGFARAIARVSIPGQFRDFARGVVSLSGVFYFLALAAAMLYLNIALLGRRHWAGGESRGGKWLHAIVRAASVVVALTSAYLLVAKIDWPIDLSSEGLSTLSSESRHLVQEIPANRPVYIQAFLSPEVPRDYVETKANLVALLRSYESMSGGRIRLNLIDTERFGDEARQAETRFGITPRRVFTQDEARQGIEEIFLGVAFTSGPEQVVIPFFDRGLPIEYELTRSIRVVTGAERKKVGILATDANLLGGFDFRAMAQDNEWEVVTELKKQYNVSSVPADSPIPTNLDALVVAQPSSLTQPQIDNLVAYVKAGGPALILLDPLPQFDRSMQMSLAPTQPKESPGGMFGGGPPPEQKGDLRPLLDLLGIEWPMTEVVWNPYNPHPKFSNLPPEYVFAAASGGAKDAFNSKSPVTSGLQEMILLFPGLIRPKGGEGPEFTPLLRTDAEGGVVQFQAMMGSGFLGGMTLDPRNATHIATGTSYTLAARIQGMPADANSGDAKAKPVDAIVVADLDFISDVFFNLRESGSADLEFDNVTFILNSVDELAGDSSFVALRKQRRQQRTLTDLEEQDRNYEKTRLAEEKKAQEEADNELRAAREGMQLKIRQIDAKEGLDDRTKQIMLANQREIEERKLSVAEANIEDAKRRKVEESFAEKERKLRQIRGDVRRVVVFIPIPVLILGALVFFVRSGRENRGANPNRLA
jgi:ABC-type uncharacterized transport system involved in gliding motility auxiliary subunit/ABC-type transport system involved in multi-copper enzyme maturation permease subunit